MSEPQGNRPERRAAVILRRADQACAATIVAVGLAVLAAFWAKEWGRRDDRIDIAPHEPLRIDFRVDVNSAPWTELAALPGLGETLAKRIVASRETEGPFVDHDELRRVRGIGPITLDRIKPYLAPIPHVEEVVGR